LRDFNFLGFVVLITAVETVDNSVWSRESAVKPCSWSVGGVGFKQAVDGDNELGRFGQSTDALRVLSPLTSVVPLTIHRVVHMHLLIRLRTRIAT
jgi:hypothetical protein